MGKAPAFQFYPGDWRRDTQVQMASMETRGVWFESLCCMWDAPKRGKLEGSLQRLMKLLHCGKDELIRALNEIHDLKIGDVSATSNGKKIKFPLRVTQSNISVTLCNRRMYREEKSRENTRLRVQKHRMKRKGNKNVTLHSSSSSSSNKRNVTKTFQKKFDEPPKYKDAVTVLKDKGML